MDKSQTVNAPFPIRLGDHDLEMRAVSDAKIGLLDNWVRGQYVANLRPTLEGLSQAERDESLRIIFAQAAKMTAFEGRGATLLSTPMGLAKLVQVTCETDVPVEELHKLLHDVVNVAIVNEAFAYLNRRRPGKEPSRAPGPASSQRKKRTLRSQPTTS